MNLKHNNYAEYNVHNRILLNSTIILWIPFY